MAVQSNPIQTKNSLNTPIFSLLKINWEITLYALFILIALVTRFYDLGLRVMSHDESLHTVYSWNLYAGKGYQHDPLMHGPFLFHINALIYFLFGDSDFTARISTALFGVVLVALPYWFRPWLGRIGAIAAAFMVLISPGLLYYSRYIRHDIFISVWTVLMYLAFFQYMRYRRNVWLYIGAAAVAFMLSTKEVSYIHGFIGISFIGFAYLWENLGNGRRILITWSIMVGVLFLAALAGLGMYLQPPAGEEVNVITDYMDEMIMIVGMLISFVLIQFGVDRQNRPVSQAIKSLGDRWPEIGKAALLGAVIFILLYTTFFSNIYGLVSGTWGAVTYWLSQQEVQRGSQPWYYYLFLVPLYEFLPVIIGLLGIFVYLAQREIKTLFNLLGKVIPFFRAIAQIMPETPHNYAVLPDHTLDFKEDEVAPRTDPSETLGDLPATPQIWPSDGGLFAVFTIYWTLLATIIYSWAGEKMPWLTIHITLPFIFLTAHVIQTALRKYRWSEARQKGGLTLGLAVLLLIPAFVALVAAQPFQGQSLSGIEGTIQFIAALIVIIVLVAVIWYYSRQMGSALATRTAFIAGLIPLILLTIRFTWLLSFVNFDYVNEMLVYAHASPDVKLALDQIDDISRRTVGDKMIKIAYDNDSTWPLEWYLREYPNRVYYGENPTREALDAPVVIVGSVNESKVKPFLGDNYTRFRYRLVWWPIEDYKGQTLSKLWQNYVTGPPADPANDTIEAQQARREVVRQNWKKMWNIIFYRNYEDYELNEWPFVHRFFVYVRKDVATEIWDYTSGPIEIVQQQTVDPYEGKRTEFEAIAHWGNNGSAEGQFVMPRNLAVGPDGAVYVADSGNHRIQVFDTDGNFLLQWGSKGTEPGQFDEPWGIAVGPDGTVYVADTWNHRIQAFTANGEFLWTTGTFVDAQGNYEDSPGNFWGPRGLAVDSEGNVYVADTGNKRIHKFTADGQFVDMWGTGGIVPGAFEEPVGIALDSQDNIYVADTWNRRIQKFDPEFNPVAEWEVVGWDSEGVVNKPFITIDSQDRIYISDPEGYRLIAYNPAGEVLATWGQYGQDLASLALPLGLDFDLDGNLLVVDSDNNRVLKFTVPEIALGSE